MTAAAWAAAAAVGIVTTAAGLLLTRLAERPPRHRGPCNGLWMVRLEPRRLGRWVASLECMRCQAMEPLTSAKLEAARAENEAVEAVLGLSLGGEHGER